MRRPHVYERSAPRAHRTPSSGAVGDPAAGRRHLLRLIANAIHEAEALGLAEVAAGLEAAMRSAGRVEPDGDRPGDPGPGATSS